MIRNETEIRVALQAVLAGILAFSGHWGYALVTLLLLVPWNPVLAAGGYLTQPIVDWWIERAGTRQEMKIEQDKQELDARLRPANREWRPAPPAVVATTSAREKPLPRSLPQPLQPCSPTTVAGRSRPTSIDNARDPSGTLAIPPAIKHHVQNSPQGVLKNMDLEIEEVNIHGDTADATVRFKSPNVTGLIIRQMYALRKSGDEWLVEVRQREKGVGQVSGIPAAHCSDAHTTPIKIKGPFRLMKGFQFERRGPYRSCSTRTSDLLFGRLAVTVSEFGHPIEFEAEPGDHTESSIALRLDPAAKIAVLGQTE